MESVQENALSNVGALDQSERAGRKERGKGERWKE